MQLIDIFNVKAQYKRAPAYLNLGMVEETLKDLQVAIRFEPFLSKVEYISKSTRGISSIT